MKGDFTRLTFRPEKHFSRVLRQQGRVTLDADDNEQTAILLHYLRTLARDLVGPYAAPASADGGFVLATDAPGAKLTLSKGRVYVDGILVENQDDPYEISGPVVDQLNATDTAWLYLDVWERHITAIEDDSIREMALNGPDTCTRAQVVWQVKSLLVPQSFDDRISQLGDDAEAKAAISKVGEQFKQDIKKLNDDKVLPVLCGEPTILLEGLSTASLTARVDPGAKHEDPCVLPPDSKYRGLENQLYRVEIHRGGRLDAKPTFKWSRDNGSVATGWLGGEGTDLTVAQVRGFAAGNWVELTHDAQELAGEPGELVKVTKVEGNTLSLETTPSLVVWSAQLQHPRVRRWDQVQRDDIVLDQGTVPIEESPVNAPEDQVHWIDLEDGIQVAFTAGGEYRSGDYWLIPARVASGSIEWSDSMALPPYGIEHYYAPLGFVTRTANGLSVRACRCTFSPGTSCLEAATIVRPKRRITVTPRPAPARPVPERRRRG